MKCTYCYGEVVNGVCTCCGASLKKHSSEPIIIKDITHLVSGVAPGPTIIENTAQIKKLTVVGEATDMVCLFGLQPGYRMYAYERSSCERNADYFKTYKHKPWDQLVSSKVMWHRLSDSEIGDTVSPDRDIIYVAVAESGDSAIVASKCKLMLEPLCSQLVAITRLEEFILENVDTSHVRGIREPFGMYAIKRTNLFDLPMPLLEDIKGGIIYDDSIERLDIEQSWNTLSSINSLARQCRRLRVLNLPNFRNNATHPLTVDGLVNDCVLLQEVIMPHLNTDNVVGNLFKRRQDIPLWLDFSQGTSFNPETFIALHNKVFNNETLDLCSRMCLSETWTEGPVGKFKKVKDKWKATYMRLLCWRNSCEKKRDTTTWFNKKQFTEDDRIGLIMNYKGEPVNVLSDKFILRCRGQLSVEEAEFCDNVFKMCRDKYLD